MDGEGLADWLKGKMDGRMDGWKKGKERREDISDILPITDEIVLNPIVAIRIWRCVTSISSHGKSIVH